MTTVMLEPVNLSFLLSVVGNEVLSVGEGAATCSFVKVVISCTKSRMTTQPFLRFQEGKL